MYFTIYKTTDIRNGCIYVGKHKTTNLHDGYFGTGNIVSNIYEKHGTKYFKTEILMICESEDEMNDVEKLLVDDSFINRLDVYNIALGGNGGAGPSLCRTPESFKEGARKAGKTQKGRTKETHQYLIEAGKKSGQSRQGRSKETHESHHRQSLKISGINNPMKNEITRRKVSESSKGHKKPIGYQNGDKNHMFGKFGEKSHISKLTR